MINDLLLLSKKVSFISSVTDFFFNFFYSIELKKLFYLIVLFGKWPNVLGKIVQGL